MRKDWNWLLMTAVFFIAAVLMIAGDRIYAQGPGGDRGRGDDRGRGPQGEGFRGGPPSGDSHRGGPPGGGYRPQGPPSGDPRRGGYQPSQADTDRRLQWYEQMLKGWDTNGNGKIDEAEVSQDGRRKYYVERIVQRAGIEATYPISIKRVQEGLKKTSGQGSSSSSSSKSKGEGTPLVPGFGVEVEVSPAPGFGGTIEKQEKAVAASPRTRTLPAQSSHNHAQSSQESSTSTRGKEHEVRRYAQSLLRQYDKNRNGKLEKDEWSNMRGNPAESDRNKDGVITSEELTDRLMNYSRGRSGGGSSDSLKKSYRFLSPSERWPDGLPDWFAERDSNEDGQIAMCEYATLWSDVKALEFEFYDLNNDGLITPLECLEADEDQ